MKNLITSATDTRIKNLNASVNDLVWLYRQKTVIFMHLVGMAIALLTPIEEISSGTFIERVVDGVLNVIPMGRNFSVRSTFPELVRLQAAVMTFFIPAILSLYLSSPEFVETKIRMLRIMKSSKTKSLLIHFLPFFAIGCLLSHIFWVEGTEFAVAPFLSSRFFLGVFGPIIFCLAPSGMICGIFVTFIVLFKFWRGIFLNR